MICDRCDKDIKDLRAHTRRVHPQEYWWKADMSAPHETAIKVTFEDQTFTREGHEITFGEWKVERYGFRQHGWFIPVEVEDNVDLPTVPEWWEV